MLVAGEAARRNTIALALTTSASSAIRLVIQGNATDPENLGVRAVLETRIPAYSERKRR
ncbi:MAG TPA: hypothetical protein VG425_13775 [Casimicrobiaceae bacterium]|jgi:hypothetical protein|nr:hypothetical protein [Casimicrobiaceae bacterium]